MEEKKNIDSEVLTAEDAKALAPLYSDVIKALKQVYDPEIPVNIYDLGLIYEIIINKEHDVYLKMTFTAPNCPMADEVMNEAKVSVESCRVQSMYIWDLAVTKEIGGKTLIQHCQCWIPMRKSTSIKCRISLKLNLGASLRSRIS